jgi:hypothetical protein
MLENNFILQEQKVEVLHIILLIFTFYRLTASRYILCRYKNLQYHLVIRWQVFYICCC